MDNGKLLFPMVQIDFRNMLRIIMNMPKSIYWSKADTLW